MKRNDHVERYDQDHSQDVAERSPKLKLVPPDPKKKSTLLTIWLWFIWGGGAIQAFVAQDARDLRLGIALIVFATTLIWFRTDEG